MVSVSSFIWTLLTDYHSLYYQYDPIWMSCCPLTIHMLLHIVPSIRPLGLVWLYWAFPMECYWSEVLWNIRSCQHSYTSINKYVTSQVQLTQVTLLYNLHEELCCQPLVSHDQDIKLHLCMLLAIFLNTDAHFYVPRSINRTYTTKAICNNPPHLFVEDTYSNPSHSLWQTHIYHSQAHTQGHSNHAIWSSLPTWGWGYYAHSWTYSPQIWQSRHVICPGMSINC